VLQRCSAIGTSGVGKGRAKNESMKHHGPEAQPDWKTARRGRGMGDIHEGDEGEITV